MQSVTIAVLITTVFGCLSAFLLAWFTVSQTYALTPAASYVMLGGLTANSVSFRLFGVNDPVLRISKTPDLAVSIEYTVPNSTAIQDRIADSTNRSLLLPPITPAASDVFVATLNVQDLEPQTQYYYQIDDMTGSFRTTALPGTRFNFTVAAAGCAFTGSKSQVFDAIREDDPTFLIHMGDFHYEDIGTNDMGARMRAVRTVLQSKQQATLLRNSGLVYIWDDHDYFGNNILGYDEMEAGARQTALDSYRLGFPSYPLETTDGAPYHAFTVGTVRFIVCDVTSESSPASIMSNEQRSWLLGELEQATKFDFVVWVTSKPWIGDATSPSEDNESWIGYADDRHILSDFIANSTATNILALAADMHLLGLDDGSHTNYATDEMARSFPILQSGPFDRPGSSKDGIFSEGCYAFTVERNHQYSLLRFEFTEDGGACIHIEGYRLMRSGRKTPILEHSLCGTDIFRAPTPEDPGTCDISRLSPDTNAVFSLAAALTVVTWIWSALRYERRQCCGLNSTATFGLAFSLVVGLGTPVLRGIQQVDTFAIGCVLMIQSTSVLVVTIIYGYRRGKRSVWD